MANYNFVIDNNTNPYDYASALIPIFTNYGNKWDTKYEKAKLELLDRLALKHLIELENDEKLLELYSQYDTKFNDFFDSFNRGYDSNTEKLGLEANKLYNESIIPIDEQIKKRSKYIDELRLLRQNNETLMFDTDFRDVKISDMLDNPNMSYNSYNGEDIRNRTAEAVKSLSSAYYRVLLNPNDAANNNENKTDLYLANKVLLGYSLSEIIDSVEDDNNAPIELKNLKNNIRNTYGYEGLNQDIKNHIDYYINEGLYSGVGEAEQSWLSNRNYESAMDIYNRERLIALDELEAQKALNKQLEAQIKASEKGWDMKKIPGDDNNESLYEATRGGRTIISRNLDEIMTAISQEGVQLTPSEKIKSGSIVAGVVVDKNNTENPVIGLKMLGDEEIRSQEYNYDNRSNGFNSLLIENRWGRKDVIKNKDNLDLQNAFEVSDFGTQEVKDAIFTAFTTNPNIYNLLSNSKIIDSITEEYYQLNINNSEEIKKLYTDLENLENQIENSKDRNIIENLKKQYNTIIDLITKKLLEYHTIAYENASSDINSYLLNPTYYNDSETKKVIINYIIHAIKGGQLSLISVPGTDRRKSQNDYILIQNRR